MKKGRILSPTKQKVLLLLAGGLILTFNQSPSRQKFIFKKLVRAWKDIDRQYLYRIVKEFRHERLVDYQEQSDGSIKIILTEKGQQKVLLFDFDKLGIKRPLHWNGNWYLFIYDIPESKKALREAIRDKVKELGFYEWQKSVFIHPYPCWEEINFIIEFFDARPFVRYGELHHPANEAELKLHFGL